MKKLLLILCAVLAPCLAQNALAKDVSLSMAYTNALDADLPFSIFSKHSWSPDPKAKYVKLHLYFDEPIKVQKLEIDSCGTTLDKNLSIFINFDQWALRNDPLVPVKTSGAIAPKQKGDRYIIDNLPDEVRDSNRSEYDEVPENEGPAEKVEVRSITINFERSQGFKICGIHLKDPLGQTYNIKTPALVKGTVKASSTLDPQTAYDPIYLFDSRFEYGWASNKKAKDVDLTFNFDEPRRIEKIRIWNGYQRSVNHCQANSRAKAIRVTGDGGYSEVITIRDVLGAQEVALPKPYTGKQLKFAITESFRGNSYPDLVISELRFYDGQQWFMLDPTRKLQENIAANRAHFAQAGTDGLLGESYGGHREFYFSINSGREVAGPDSAKDDEMVVSGSDSATLRFRPDGSFYVSGRAYSMDKGRQYFALGNYEVKSADAKQGMRLRLFGIYYSSPVYGDCNGCGRDCNKNVPTNDGTTQNIFQEFVTIKPVGDGKFAIVNESGGKKLHFKKYELQKE